MEYITKILPSGLKIAYLPDQSEVTYLGFGIGVGTRHEEAKQHGMAHLVEHMLFKGTHKRNAKQIIYRMEEVGADLNAYTTKEDTFIYAAFSKRHLNRAMVLMSDIVTNSIFPGEELEKEKEVIIDEINSYKDSPAELIYDEFENLLFGKGPLGHAILGNERSVKGIDSEAMRQFFGEHYQPENMLLFAMGQLDFDYLTSMAEYYFPANATAANTHPKKATAQHRPQLPPGHYIHKRKRTHQHHCMIGNWAYDKDDDRRYVLSMLTNILGGPGMNARLNMKLREECGLVYSVEASYTAYSDVGIFAIYYGCSKANATKAHELVLEVLANFRNSRLTETELTAAKQQLKGQLAISNDNRENVFMSMGKNLLRHDYFDSMKDLYARIDAITSEQIYQVANEILVPESLVTLAYD